MASMNYCLTLCHAAEEKYKQKTEQNTSQPVDIPKSNSSNNGTKFFGHFFSFGSLSAASASMQSNSWPSTYSSVTDIDPNPF
ncbi:unnamed protein product [Rotaria sp. Silwood1]|nr:unnamed protein product [Rotaria sp. Silwood1]CAF3671740.1 unnamed protein product [Rotaria sp. Silwood1]CAF3761864.1 unnamed protein product [Rotaria sp. Silwood1]CAF3787020.1 unnamed protein product [Rotaria sp. Silwood1]CAF4600670.1 unnamed protein product [Rotaria sp. Silwood1]